MISKIKCYRIEVVDSILGEKIYEKCDITNQLEQPIYDSAIRDGTHDTTRLSLLNNEKEPISPLSRIILEVFDKYGETTTVEKVYRVVDNDVVTNIVKGRKPIYRHSLDLLEPTKILERRDIDNLSFTNYLPSNYGVEERAVDFMVVSEKNSEYWTTIYGANTGAKSNGVSSVVYTEDSNRFIGPYVNIGESNKTISTNVMLQVKYLRKGALSYLPASPTEAKLEEYFVKKPDNTTVSLIRVVDGVVELLVPEITLDMVGEYVFTQRYTGYFEVGSISAGGTDYVHAIKQCIFSYTVSWTLTVIKDENDAAKEKSIAQVVDRILSVGQVRTQNQSLEFKLDDNIRKELSRIKAPEFSTGGTLFEALCQVGNFFNAIPRLIPSEEEKEIVDENGKKHIIVDDYSKWDVITFDFLGKPNRIGIFDKHSLIDLENPLESFATEYVSNVQNVSITNSSSKFSIAEPYEGGFIAPKTESAHFEISDNEFFPASRR